MTSRPSTIARRVGATVGPVVVGAVLLAACGGSESSATRATIDLDATSTAFVVRPPASTVPPTSEGAEAAADEGARVEGTQEYTVQAGDYPFLLVERFDITLEDLVAVNDWASADQFPGPGAVILIPPGARSVTSDSGDSEGDAAGEEAAPAADADEGAVETIPDAGDNCAPGSYTIEAGDTTRIGVAEKFDVTVEALDAANAGTSGYGAFFPGLEIVIPAKDDC